MKNRKSNHISMLTLGVKNLEASSWFYQQLGWHKIPKDYEEMVLFQGTNQILALYPAEKILEELGLNQEASNAVNTKSVYAQNLSSEQEVIAQIEKARVAHAKVLKEPSKTPWGGFSGFFQDLDGHVWEIAWNPFWPVDEKGVLSVPL